MQCPIDPHRPGVIRPGSERTEEVPLPGWHRDLPLPAESVDVFAALWVLWMHGSISHKECFGVYVCFGVGRRASGSAGPQKVHNVYKGDGGFKAQRHVPLGAWPLAPWLLQADPPQA